MKYQTNKRLPLLITALALSLTITGCDFFDDDDDTPVAVDDTGDMNGTDSDTETPSLLNQLSGQTANSDPIGISDSSTLQMDITAQFGEPNGEPVALEEGESLENIIKRVGG